MKWFGKKKEVKENPKENYKEDFSEELPKLPELPRISELPKFHDIPETKYFGMQKSPEIKNYQEHQALPSFPGSNLGEDFRQESIKSAIGPAIPAIERRTVEISESKAPKLPKHKFSAPSQPYEKLSKKIEPVYIRIDKFEFAIKSFKEIKNKVSEIEDLLSEIKEIKQKEDEEFRAWEHELEIIKSRIEAIDKSIFSKLD